jgi:glycosyltransferase involved in cell wall biosynthesis
VESVLNQTFKDFEIIIVDDGSTDEVAVLIEPWIKDGTIRYLRQSNKGAAVARNAGIRLAKGKFLKFLDCDDLLYPQQLDLQVRHLENKPGSVISATDYELAFPSKRKKICKIWLGEDKHQLAQFIKGNPCPIHTILIRRDIFQEAGGFDENLHCHEDSYIWLQLLIRNCSFERLAYTGCLYVIMEGTLSEDRNKMFHQHCRFSEKLNQLLLPKLKELPADVIEQLLISNTKLIHACFLRRINPGAVLPVTLQVHKAAYMVQTKGLKKFILKLMDIRRVSLLQYLKRNLQDKNYSKAIRDMDVFWRNEQNY